MPHDYLAQPSSDDDRRYQAARGRGDGRRVAGIIPLSRRSTPTEIDPEVRRPVALAACNPRACSYPSRTRSRPSRPSRFPRCTVRPTRSRPPRPSRFPRCIAQPMRSRPTWPSHLAPGCLCALSAHPAHVLARRTYWPAWPHVRAPACLAAAARWHCPTACQF